MHAEAGMTATSKFSSIVFFSAFLLLFGADARGQTAWREITIFDFNGNNGISPTGVVFDAQGNLYSSTLEGGQMGGGTIIRLSPPALGTTKWIGSVIYDLREDNLFSGAYSNVEAPFAMDQAGNIYDATDSTGRNQAGSVFMLTVPPVGQRKWPLKTLHAFGPRIGHGIGHALNSPTGNVVVDAVGNVYGTAQGGAPGLGAVFELTRPTDGSAPWSITTIYLFPGSNGTAAYPSSGVIFDAQGNLYGEASNTSGVVGGGAGVVFKLTPPTGSGTNWTAMTLYTFTGSPDGEAPIGGLIFDSAGNLYGTTSAGGSANKGTVFELSPPAAGNANWSETILYSFTGVANNGNSPDTGVVMNKAGALFGSAAGGVLSHGVVFQLTPPATGQTTWTEKVIYAFISPFGRAGTGPSGPLAIDGTGNLYGAAGTGGTGDCTSGGNFLGCGTVFELSPP
jgi:uncharacterized repeat protein (TIGR03803 family)